MKKLLKIAVFWGLLLTATQVTRADYSYSAKNLGAMFSATGLNDRGEVVGYGYADRTSNLHTFLYDQDGLHDLGTFGGRDAIARGINDSGQIVGFVMPSDGSAGHAFLYQNGSATDLNSLIDPKLGMTLFDADAINNKGQIVGTCRTASGETHVYLYDKGSVSDWSVPGVDSIGSLNNNGEITGNYFTKDGNSHGFILNNGSMTDLAVPGAVSTSGGRINYSGTVVGGYWTPDHKLHTFLYSEDVYTLLGGDRECSGGDINDSGLVVGPDGHSSAYLYENGNFTDLNALIDPSSEINIDNALLINNQGQIVTYAKGDGRVFLLTPIPEPSSISLLIIGFLGFLTYGKFKKGAT